MVSARLMLQFFPIPGLARTAIASGIAVLTLLCIMTRPFRWNEPTIAMGGAALLLILGLVQPLEACQTLLQDWNTFLFFLGMMALAALAEAAGMFEWLAIEAARLAGNSAARLFFNVFVLGTLISMILSNDATALILTPIVYVLVTRLRLPVLPFMFACTFIADTASFLLPISNPINIIVLSRLPLDIFTFLRLLFIPSLVVIAINTGVFFLLYRRELTRRFDQKRLDSPAEAIKNRAYFRYTAVILIGVAVAYVVASAVQFPLSIIALSGATLLLAGALTWRMVNFAGLAKRISWSIFGFIAGMFLIVRAIEDTGLTALFGAISSPVGSR